MILPTTAKIFSTLGNNNSLVPLAIKDITNSLGLTAGSYITGDKTEGKDRFIDEFGTQSIWLFGIPAYKKIIDKTVYKLAGLNADVDVRILKNKDILKKAIEFAPTQQAKAALEKIAKNPKMFKNLALGKFFASTALTLVSYMGLTHYRHAQTEKDIAKNYRKKKASEKFVKETVQAETSFQSVHKKKSKKTDKKVSFGSGFQEFMFNPVKNLMIVDGGITAERLGTARNPQDFMGYVIKEASFWGFMYFAGAKIQSFFEGRAKKKHNKSIDLDARVVEHTAFKKAFEDKSILKSLQQFPEKATDVEIYEFLHKNPDNLVVRMAKKSDVIAMDKDNWFGKMAKKLGLKSTERNSKAIDTRKYIDIDDVKAVKSKMAKLYEEFIQSNQTTDVFFKKVKTLKRASILKNIGACVGALGIVVPAVMVAIRLLDKDNKEFQTKKDVEAKLAMQG